MSRMPALSALGEIEAMRGTLTMARALVEAGRTIDLAGLDRQAAGICRSVAALPPGGGQAVKSAMIALMRDVQALAATLPDPSELLPARRR
jgi:hypothetical protein